MGWLSTPFRQAIAILAVAYALIEFGIPYIPPLFGFASAKIPNTVVLQYLITVTVGILIWVSDNEQRWSEFKKPIHEVLIRPDRKVARGVLLVGVPLLMAFVAYGRALPDMSAPPSFRAIHPAPPLHLHFAPAGRARRNPYSQGSDVGCQSFIGAGADGSNLGNGLSSHVGNGEVVGGIVNARKDGLKARGAQAFDIGNRRSQYGAVKRIEVDHRLFHGRLSTVKSLCVLQIGYDQPALRVDQVHRACGYPGQEQDDQHG